MFGAYGLDVKTAGLIGALNDWIGIWTSCFMLLLLVASAALTWMHFAIRRTEHRQFPRIRRETVLPELVDAAQGR